MTWSFYPRFTSSLRRNEVGYMGTYPGLKELLIIQKQPFWFFIGIKDLQSALRALQSGRAEHQDSWSLTNLCFCLRSCWAFGTGLHSLIGRAQPCYLCQHFVRPICQVCHWSGAPSRRSTCSLSLRAQASCPVNVSLTWESSQSYSGVAGLHIKGR